MDEDEALPIARSKVDQACLAAGLPLPAVVIVEKLRGRKGSDFTAQFHARQGVPTIEVPLRVVREYPDDALTWLLAHEVGHYKEHAGRRVKDRLFKTGMVVFGTVLAAWTLWVVVGAVMSPVSSFGGIFVWLGFFAYTTYLALVLADSRAEERAADRFAVRYQGSMAGALQWASLPHRSSSIAVQRRGLRRWGRALFEPFNQWLGLIFSTHPYVPMRIDAMRAELEHPVERG
ncbi:M48 family metallopeptidase [Arthrobacter bussei]|uniref:M48 family metallopeptidase n=1 Tax=Arthrobacter bussei TaxID=2594179 RepID=UPI00128DA77A|nr:M48 family metalloprotease [Arthrobacter bussei]